MVPPQNLDAEESVLGSMMVSAAVVAPVRLEAGLEAGHFYRDRHRTIFEAICRLDNRGEPVDVLTVTEALAAAGELEKVGGKDIVANCAAKVPSPGSGKHYAEIVISNADMRRLDAAAKTIQQSVAERDGEPSELIAAARKLLDESGPTGDPYLSPQQLVDLAYEVAEGKHSAGKLIPWPFEAFNRITGGHRTGQLGLVSGWTHHGKSIWGGMIAETAATVTPKVCFYFNEMDAEEHFGAFLQRNWRVPSLEFIQGRLDELGRKQLIRALGSIESGKGAGPPPFGMCPIAGRDAQWIATHIRQHRWDVAVIDILHNIRYEDERDLSNAVSTFVEAAKLAECSVILVSHLNRGRLHDVTRPRPTLRDLRGTGDLENKADWVCFVHRDQDEETGYPEDLGEIFLAKFRGIPKLGGKRVRFDSDRLRFLEVDGRFGDPGPQMERVA